MNRRRLLKRLLLLTAGFGTGIKGAFSQTDVNDEEWERLNEKFDKRARDREEMEEKGRKQRSKDMEEDAREVEELYSTKPIRFRMGKREYAVPVNYFTPKGRDNKDSGDSQGFGFFLFLPDYGGYTKENWRDPFDPRLIQIVQVNPVDKNAIGNFSDGTKRPLSPDRFDPRVNFEGLRFLMEEKPSFHLYGLEGYRSKGGGSSTVTWTGKRSNGEFFYFKSSLAPVEPTKPGITNPGCDVRYYSAKEDLYIIYRYSQTHIEKWREIDDAIWTKLHEWQVKGAATNADRSSSSHRYLTSAVAVSL